MNKILITGGSGFIGTNLIQYYLEKNIKVLNIDINPPRDFSQVDFWEKVDINDYQHLFKVIKIFNPQYVIHLAACTDLNGTDLEYYDTNIRGTRNLIKILNSLSSVERVIFTSSMLVCKAGDYSYNPQYFTSDTIYGKSKAVMEMMINSSKHSYVWSIVRPTSIWGPWFGEPYFVFFKLLINKTYFHFNGTNSVKTYGYIGNSIYQIDSILNAASKKIHSQIFYLGDYNLTDIKSWADEIALVLNYKILSINIFIIKTIAFVGDLLKFFRIKFPMTTFRLKNMSTNNIINLDKTFLIAPDLPFDRKQGIISTVEWIKSNK